MARMRSDLPFERDQSNRFLPWIVGVMVFLAALAVASAIVVGNAVQTWDTGLSGRLTVQVPRATRAEGGGVDRVVAMLRATPGVAAAQPLPTEAVVSLLEPWLGAAVAEGDLPLPHLIDVRIVEDARLDSTILAERLATAVPGIAVDDHRVWLAGVIGLARTVEILALAIVGLIAICAMTAVVFATRSGLAVHHRIIELLHFMGARDAYVARQFQRHAMELGLRGGLIGTLAAAAVMLAVSFVARGVDAAFLPPLSLTVEHWLIVAAVPVGATVIAMVTARLTVLRALARMP
ncbi:MAG: cell division protein FtsX [Alphaproteobacteria bacterium]